MDHQLQRIGHENKRIILKIISGNGFSLVKGSIEVHATLTKKKFQTTAVSVNKNEVKFDSEIVWSMDTNELKNLKMSSASIRVECYHIPTKKSSPHEKLGYILLKVKGAQTFNPESNDRINIESHKMIGSKNGNYSLNMSLRIEDFNVKAMEILQKKQKNLKLTNKDNIFTDCNLQKVEENDHLDENVEMILPQTNNNILEDASNRNEILNVFSFDVHQKLIKELEDWKDKQMILFNENLKMKEGSLLNDLNIKWSDDRKRIEEELAHKMSKCNALAENLEEMADMLKEKEAIVTAKELDLFNQRDSMDSKYISLIQNLQTSNAQTIGELSNKIVELETKLRSSENTIILLKKQLKDDVNTSNDLEVQQLKKTISNLESKCEEANKSSMFFKERWIASVRKMNQMNSKLYVSKSNHHLLNSRQNIQNELTNQLAERQNDEENLRTLLNDLSKLRQDMTNTI